MNNELNFALQMFVDRFTKQTGEAPSLDVMNDFLQAQATQMNNRPKDDFDELSPDQMFRLNYQMWSEDSPIILNELSDEDLAQIPIFRQVEKLTSILTEKGKIKMTVRGSLPMSVVKEVYSVGTPSWYLEKYRKSRITEDDTESVQRTHILLKIMKVIKVQKGIMTLTAKGSKLIQNRQQFFKRLFEVFSWEFNLAYFDGYEDRDIGMVGIGFSLVLMSKYGGVLRRSTFYAEKYFRAFPVLSPTDTAYSEDVAGENSYTSRVFTRFMLELGLIEIQEERVQNEFSNTKFFDTKKNIIKTELFDRVLTINL